MEANANQKTNREDVAAAVVAQYLLVLKAFADYEATAAQVALAERLFEQATELQKTGVALLFGFTFQGGCQLPTLRWTVILRPSRRRFRATFFS